MPSPHSPISFFIDIKATFSPNLHNPAVLRNQGTSCFTPQKHPISTLPSQKRPLAVPSLIAPILPFKYPIFSPLPATNPTSQRQRDTTHHISRTPHFFQPSLNFDTTKTNSTDTKSTKSPRVHVQFDQTSTLVTTTEKSSTHPPSTTPNLYQPPHPPKNKYPVRGGTPRNPPPAHLTMGKKKGSSAFPVARIKKMMQADEDVGKIATATPILVGKALECMIEDVLGAAAAVAIARRAKTVQPAHLREAVDSSEKYDFLRPTLQNAPRLEDKAPGTPRGEHAGGEAKRPRSPKLGAGRNASAKRPRVPAVPAQAQTPTLGVGVPSGQAMPPLQPLQQPHPLQPLQPPQPLQPLQSHQAPPLAPSLPANDDDEDYDEDEQGEADAEPMSGMVDSDVKVKIKDELAPVAPLPPVSATLAAPPDVAGPVKCEDAINAQLGGGTGTPVTRPLTAPPVLSPRMGEPITFGPVPPIKNPIPVALEIQQERPLPVATDVASGASGENASSVARDAGGEPAGTAEDGNMPGSSQLFTLPAISLEPQKANPAPDTPSGERERVSVMSLLS